MERRQFTREFKLEALIKQRGVSYAQASAGPYIGSNCKILKRGIVLPGFPRQRTFARFLGWFGARLSGRPTSVILQRRSLKARSIWRRAKLLMELRAGAQFVEAGVILQGY
jgi:hypothetical protein